MKKHLLIALITFFALFCQLHFCAELEQKTSFISEVADINLSIFPWESEGWSEENYATHIKKSTKIRKNPGPKDRRSNAFEFLKQVDEKTPYAPHSVFNDKTTWIDLNLLCGESDKNHYLGHVLDKTFLELGTINIMLTLITPIDDVSTLLARQEVVKLFLNCDQTTERLRNLFSTLCVPENVMISLWRHDSFKHAAKRIYFTLPGFKWLNKYRHMLLIKDTLNHYRQIAWTVSGAIGGITLATYGLFIAGNINMPEKLQEWGKGYQSSTFGALLSLVDNRLFRPIGNFFSHLAQKRLLVVTGAAGASAISLMGAPSSARWAYECFVIEDCLQQLMIDVASYVNGMRTTYDIIKTIPELANYTEFADLIGFFEDIVPNSQELQELLWLLQKNTFKEKSSVFSHKGNLLRAFKILHDKKEAFEKAMISMGNIDKWLSIAQLYKKSLSTSTPFCFAQYDNTPKPYINLQNFWHPLINTETIVPNSITLGTQQHRPNLLVTGPNAGGKSTALKAIANCVVMAQTFGIVPAEFMQFTPFSFIATYLNITDDIGAGNSLFKAEVKRTDKLLTSIEDLDNGQHSFVIFDEIFNGTSPLEGMACAYSVAKHLASIEKNICLVATHFKPLTTLEKTTDSFTNYKVSVIHKKGGGITYPYKLEQGISDQHIAIDILKDEGFESKILSDAHEIVQAYA